MPSQPPPSSLRHGSPFPCYPAREFERVLEVNPGCTGGGPSLGLGWNYNIKQSMSLEDFEISKQKSEKKKTLSPRKLSPMRIIRTSTSSSSKKKDSMVLSAAKREKLAKQLGFSKAEIQKNVEEVQKVKRQRERTAKHLEQKAIEKFRQEVVSLHKAGKLKRVSSTSSCA